MWLNRVHGAGVPSLARACARRRTRSGARTLALMQVIARVRAHSHSGEPLTWLVPVRQCGPRVRPVPRPCAAQSCAETGEDARRAVPPGVADREET